MPKVDTQRDGKEKAEVMIAYPIKIHPCHDGGQTKLPKERAKPMPKEKAEAKVQKHQNGRRLTAKFLLSEAARAKYCCLTQKTFTKIITLTRFNQLVLTSAALNLVS
jgi:hypothetical protein